MGLSNVLLLSQIAGHVIALILSLCIIAPMSLSLHRFNGNCLLFATGEWQEEDGLFDVRWASQGFCNFPLITGILLLLVSSIEIYRLSWLAYKQLEASFLGLFFDVVFGMLLCAMTVLSAIMITLGFIVWCSDMTQRFHSCEVAAGQNITKEEEKVDTTGFYLQMGTAQFGAWGSFAIWVGLSVFALLKLINNHQMLNMKVSMYLERQRLVNEDAQFMGTSSVPGTSTPPLQAADATITSPQIRD